MSTSSGPHTRESFRGATLKSIAIAVVAAGAIAFLMGRHLLPQTSAASAAPAGIWFLSAFVLLAGLARGVLDHARLRNEWRALDLLDADPERPSSQYPDGTVVALRVAGVNEARAQQRVEREFRQSHRALSSIRLGQIGTLTRFGSSALLVLAVMGTFAGMRSALPSLIDAIGNAGAAAGAGGVLGTTEIKTSLGIVSEAFGSNFVALFGSLVLGVVAFGAALERRELLTRLESVSERRLYALLPADADASELQKAVQELQRSVEAVARIGHSVERLGQGIGDLKATLRDTMSEMHASFSQSVQTHGVRLQKELNDTVGQMVKTLGTTTAAMQTTATSYEGLVKALEERDLGVRLAAEALVAHTATLTSTEGRAASAVTQASMAAERAETLVQRVTELADGAVTSLADSSTRLVETAAAQESRFAAIGERLHALGLGQEATTAAVRDGTQAVQRAAADMVSTIEQQVAAAVVGTESATRHLAEVLAAGMKAMGQSLEQEVTRTGDALSAAQQGIAAQEADRSRAALASLEQRLDKLHALGLQVEVTSVSAGDRTRAAIDGLSERQQVAAERVAERIEGASKTQTAALTELIGDLGRTVAREGERLTGVIDRAATAVGAHVGTASDRTVKSIDHMGETLTASLRYAPTIGPAESPTTGGSILGRLLTPKSNPAVIPQNGKNG